MSKIKVINFKSNPKQTFFAPEWDYYIFETFVSEQINFDELINLILRKKEEILKLPTSQRNGEFTDGYTGLGYDTTTAKFMNYNFLKWENNNIDLLKKEIINFHNEVLKYFKQPIPKKLWIQCWVNIMKNGDQIKTHLHGVTPTTYLGGHICVQCTDTTTNYINPINQINDPEIYSSENKIGKITLFQNNIPHFTSVHNSNKERITIAFDLSLVKIHDNFLRLI